MIYLYSASSVDFAEHLHVHGVEHIIHNRNNILGVLLQLGVKLTSTCVERTQLNTHIKIV